MIDLLEIPDLLDATMLEELRASLREAAGSPSTLLGPDGYGRLDQGVRRTTRIHVPPEVREQVLQRIHVIKPALESHFGQALGACEEPQFLRYEPGDYFVAHQDGNTPLIHDESRFRRVSAVLFLGTPSDEPGPHHYGGGALVFHSRTAPPLSRHPPAGSLVAFRAETTHEVQPVTQGLRHTVAFFFRAPEGA